MIGGSYSAVSAPPFGYEPLEKRDWLASADLTEAIAFTMPLPGSTGVQIVTFLGWRLMKWPGGLVATVAYTYFRP